MFKITKGDKKMSELEKGIKLIKMWREDVGAEFKTSQYGGYFLWPENIEL